MKKGFIAGTFDILHPGYIAMLKEAKEYCDWLVIGLQTDPTIERPEKLVPILNYEDRFKSLTAIKYIDEIYSYTTETELDILLTNLKPDVRFLGEDYKYKSFTSEYLNIEIIYISRNHGWSATKFKELIYQQVKKQNEKTNRDRIKV
jgi:glycerol-3-phosphate cytidylyltransferase